jgi:hypothetical protein
MFESTDQPDNLTHNVVRQHRCARCLLLASSVMAVVTLWSVAVVLPASGYQAGFESHTGISVDRVGKAASLSYLLPATATAPTLATDTPSTRATATPGPTVTPQPTTTPRPTVTPQPTATAGPTVTPQPTATTAVATPTPASSGKTSSIGGGSILATFGILLLIALVVMVAILLTRRNQPPTGGPGAGNPEQQQPPSQVMPPPYPPVTPPLEQEQHTYWRQAEWRQIQQETQGRFPTGSPGQMGTHPAISQPAPGEYGTSPLPPRIPDESVPDSPGSTSPGGDPGTDPAQP